MAGLRDADAGARQVGFEDGRRGVSRSVGHRPGIQHQGSAATRKSRAVAAPRSARFPREQLSVQETASEKCRCFGGSFCSFTSRKSIQLRFARVLRESKKRAAPGISGAARLASRLDSQGCGSQRPTLRRRPRRSTSRAGRCCRGCAGSSCGSPRARTRTGRACRPPRRPRRRSRTAGR